MTDHLTMPLALRLAAESNNDQQRQDEHQQHLHKQRHCNQNPNRQRQEPPAYASPQLRTISLLLLATTTAALLNPISAYNLDAHKALPKHGPRSSYFGYSIAQHAQFDQPAQQVQAANNADFANNNNNNQNVTNYRSYVIVGAPRAEAGRGSSVQRPGAVYKCDLSSSTECQPLEVDPGATMRADQLSSISANEANSRQLQQPDAGSPGSNPSGQLLASSMEPTVQRDNQWLGVAVKSQGPNGFAMACAHRQVLKGANYRWGQGICYSLTKNLTFHKSWQPCLNRPVNLAHEQYAYCQVGTSCDISESSEIILGSPGPYTWRGTVFSNSINFSPKDDRAWYMAPVQDDEAKVEYYSYLGMSIVTGRFFKKQMHYISGAPKSRESGQVLVMTKHQKRGESNLKTIQVLDGEQFGSSFGYTLAKLDFNGDGHPDLAVGAPYYYGARNKGGAVYLFANDQSKSAFVPSSESPKLLGLRESRFGFSLANCGDLNKDKYEDLAVGAPYDPKGGAVYIYFGSAAGLKPEPSQIIEASQVANQLSTFGYSLSGGQDMDRNGYPDLVVGSYADDSVYILRARPIVEISTKIEGNLSRIDANKTTCDGEKHQLPCFKFNACFELDPTALGEYSDSMKLKYRIEAETFQNVKYSRVKFQDSDQSDAAHIVQKEILLENYHRGTKLKRCNTQRVFIRDKSDIQTPIMFKLTYELLQPSGSSGGSSRSSQLQRQSSATGDLPAPFPILNQEEAQRVFSAKYLKDCGLNDICESQLDVDGQLQAPAETLGINEPGLPTDKQFNLTIRVGNAHEPAYEAKLFVSYPPSLSYSGFKASKQAAPIECQELTEPAGMIKCQLGNPMPRSSSKLSMIFQNAQNLAGTFDFNLMVNTTSQNAPSARTSYDLSATLKRKQQFHSPPRPPVVVPGSERASDWLILLLTLIGIGSVSALIYCLYVNGFFERARDRRGPYTAARTEDRFE